MCKSSCTVVKTFKLGFADFPQWIGHTWPVGVPAGGRQMVNFPTPLSHLESPLLPKQLEIFQVPSGFIQPQTSSPLLVTRNALRKHQVSREIYILHMQEDVEGCIDWKKKFFKSGRWDREEMKTVLEKRRMKRFGGGIKIP